MRYPNLESWLCAGLLATAIAAAPQPVANAADEYTFTTLAGAAGQEAGSADGVGSAARFYQPEGVAVDGAGNIYVADTYNHTIRKITQDGAVTTLAGLAGKAGSADGVGSAARFYEPEGVDVDGAGSVYVADAWNHTIRKITPDGTVSTLAGLAGKAGSADGIGSAARFYFPVGVAVDSANNVYVGDSDNSTIRRITPDGVVSTLAGQAGALGLADGTGSAARFRWPQGVAVDSAGNVYVADDYNNAIRRITPGGLVTTLARGVFDWPEDVAVDWRGNIYVAAEDSDVIQKMTPNGFVTTIGGLAGHQGSADGTGSAARFDFAVGVAVDAAGNLYVVDNDNCTIRKGVQTLSGGFCWQSAQVSASENADTLRLTVERQGTNTASATVQYFTTSGTAQAGSDFVATNGVLTFASGQTNQTVAIHLVDDSAFEGPETFTVSLRDSSTNENIMNPWVTTVTIIDDEDSDSDGLPDAWEVQHFGSTTAYDGTVDPDGDSNNNATEYADGTDPTDPASAKYALTVTTLGEGAVTRTPDLPKYDLGAVVTLSAVPESDWKFHHWTGTTNSAGNPATLTVLTNETIGVVFSPLAGNLIPLALWPVSAGESVSDINIAGHHVYAHLLQTDHRPDSYVILDVSDPTTPVQLGKFNAMAGGRVAVSGHLATVAGGGYLDIFDVRDPSNPVALGSWDAPGYSRVALQGDYAYAASSLGEVIVDVSDPANPTRMALLPDNTGGWWCIDIAAIGHYVYVTDVDGGFSVIDVADPLNPARIDGGFALGFMRITGNRLAVDTGTGDLWGTEDEIYDVTDPAQPLHLCTLPIFGPVVAAEGYAYVGSGTNDGQENGLYVFNISDPANPVQEALIPTADPPLDIAYANGCVYLAEGTNGLAIFGTTTPIPARPRIVQAQLLSDEAFQFMLQGPARSNYVIQASTNLSTWIPLATNSIPAEGVLMVNDPASTNRPTRFYRAVQR
ncbi:MAG: hypothetical protein M1608_06375 [Candidatus Omnitrophica bacterium]|nr:hypothetical protein [Candidatus Omnitrophota bacterium]